MTTRIDMDNIPACVTEFTIWLAACFTEHGVTQTWTREQFLVIFPEIEQKARTFGLKITFDGTLELAPQ